MKILLIEKAEAELSLDPLWSSLGRHCELERVRFGEAERHSFAGALAGRNLQAYDRVLMFLNMKWIGKAYRALRAVPNLVFFEEDTCQHFLPDSTWFGKFEVVFRDIGKIRVLVTNRTSETIFRRAGIDCRYLPKCYNPERISCLGKPRDIELCHVGRTRNRIYNQRRAFLEALQQRLEGLQVVRTPSGDFAAYNELLNRIRFFISADIGFREYMFKNFEAMAAGCVLVAKRQPAIEQAALGFVDMENVVLYDDWRELRSKVNVLRREKERADAIAAAGRRLVEERHSMTTRGNELFPLLVPEIGQAPPPSAWERFKTLKLSLHPV